MHDLVPSLGKTLFESNKQDIGEITELFIDSIIDNDTLTGLPVVGTIRSIIKITKNLNDRNLLKQTLQFIEEFNAGTIENEKLLKYKELINSDLEKMEEELGRVLLLLNNNVELDKSKMIANLYRNYINGILDWNEFCEYTETVKSFLVNDLDYLKKIYYGKIKDTVGLPLYPFNRLYSLGLIDTTQKGVLLIDPNGSYIRTEKFISLSKIGRKFYSAIILN